MSNLINGQICIKQEGVNRSFWGSSWCIRNYDSRMMTVSLSPSSLSFFCVLCDGYAHLSKKKVTISVDSVATNEHQSCMKWCIAATVPSLQKNARSHLLISPSIQHGTSPMRWIGLAVITNKYLTKVTRPDLTISPFCQAAINSVNLWRTGRLLLELCQ
jgi:hypothetical protein